MYAFYETPPPIEKMRKAQWSKENTAKTQAVVDRLYALRDSLRAFNSTGNVSPAMNAVRTAIRRFKTLDPNVITKGSD